MKWNGSQQKEEGGGSPTIMTSLHSSGLLFSHGYSLNLQGRQKLSFNQCGQLQVYRTTIPCNGAPFAMQHHLWIILVYLIIMSVIECNQWPHLNRCYTVTHCMLSQYLASWATLGWLGTAISHMCTTFNCSKICWLSTQGKHMLRCRYNCWKMIRFSLLTSNQYTRNQKQINRNTQLILCSHT